MRINTVQTILFQQLRKLNQQQKAGTPPRPEAGGTGATSILQMRRMWQRAVARMRFAYMSLNDWLGSYYRICGRTGFDLPTTASRTILLRANKVIRLTRESRVKHLEVRRGAVWLTGTPAQGDVLLRDGERFVMQENWPFVVQAIGNAQIVLVS